LVEYDSWRDFFDGLKVELERIANALEAIVLNMEKPKFTKQDYEDFAEISRDYEECSQCENIASDEVVINGELYWLCEQHLKEHTSDFNKMKSLTDEDFAE